MHLFDSSYTVLLLLLLDFIIVTLFIDVTESKGSFKKNSKSHPFVFIRWEPFLDVAYVMGRVRIYLHCVLIYTTRTI